MIGLPNAKRVFFSGLLALLVGLSCTVSAFVGVAEAQQNTVDYTLTDLSGRDFENADLAGTSLAAAEVRDANFKGADLSGCILTKAAFVRTDLRGANLSETFADRVSFIGSDLRDALIVDALMTSSIFNEADITGADFSNTILDRFQVAQLCKRATGENPVTGIPTRESLGCRD